MMKVAVVVLTLLVGASMAKPSLDDKLIQLLKKVLQDKDALQALQKDEESEKRFFSGSGSGFFSGSGLGFGYGGAGEDPIKTTLFNGLDAFPFRLFHDYHEITQPFDLSMMEHFDEEIRTSVDGVERIGENLDSKIEGFDAEGKSLHEVASFVLDDLIYNTILSSPDGDLTALMERVFVDLVTGAVAGTTGAKKGQKEEPGCNFRGDEDKMVQCALNKEFLAMYACAVSMEEAFETLELRECDQTWKYIEENQGELDPEDMFDSLKATFGCVEANLEEVRKQIGFRDMPKSPGKNQQVVVRDMPKSPAKNQRAPGPLYKLIHANTVLQMVAGEEWWTYVNLWMAVGAIYEQEPLGDAEKKMLHVREKFAKRMDNKYITSKHHFQARRYHSGNHPK